MPTPQYGQTHPHNSSAEADELFECISPFCGVDAQRVNSIACQPIADMLLIELRTVSNRKIIVCPTINTCMYYHFHFLLTASYLK